MWVGRQNWDGDHDENGLEVQNDLYGGHANYEEQDEELEAQHEAKREEKKAELLQVSPSSGACDECFRKIRAFRRYSCAATPQR